MAEPLITLTTDFGDRTGYVGMMKGAIYARHFEATIVDLTHAITPQRVREGAFVLGQAYRHFPPGTLHVAVVDPGVGTARRALCLDVADVGRFIGPDNGLFSYVLDAHADAVAREITNPAFMRPEPSRTFHGRDIFAPAAATLAAGAPFADSGPLVALSALVRLPNLWPTWETAPSGARRLVGEIVHIDRFGNLITNIHRRAAAALTPLELATARLVGAGYDVVGLSATYGASEPGQVIALFGSGGFLELARVNGRAAPAGEMAEQAMGLPVTLTLP